MIIPYLNKPTSKNVWVGKNGMNTKVIQTYVGFNILFDLWNKGKV